MPLDPAYKMTAEQIACIQSNLGEGVDLSHPGMRAGKAIGIHGLYGQQAPREIVENAGYFDMLRMSGVEPKTQTEAKEPEKAESVEDVDPPLGLYKLYVEDVKFLMTAAGSPSWMIEKVSSEPVQRALDRMKDATDRGGIDGMIKATAQRLKATKDPDKILGIAAAIETIIVSDEKGMTPAQVKALRELQGYAKTWAGKKESAKPAGPTASLAERMQLLLRD